MLASTPSGRQSAIPPSLGGGLGPIGSRLVAGRHTHDEAIAAMHEAFDRGANDPLTVRNYRNLCRDAHREPAAVDAFGRVRARQPSEQRQEETSTEALPQPAEGGMLDRARPGKIRAVFGAGIEPRRHRSVQPELRRDLWARCDVTAACAAAAVGGASVFSSLFDLRWRWLPARALQVVLEPSHHAQVVVELRRGPPVAVFFARVQHQPHRRLPVTSGGETIPATGSDAPAGRPCRPGSAAACAPSPRERSGCLEEEARRPTEACGRGQVIPLGISVVPVLEIVSLIPTNITPAANRSGVGRPPAGRVAAVPAAGDADFGFVGDSGLHEMIDGVHQIVELLPAVALAQLRERDAGPVLPR